MFKTAILSTLFIICLAAHSQHSASSVFAHNDYAQENPFYGTYQLRVGYIEADVSLRDNQLYVAHHENEIKKDRTLESLYLKPIREEIRLNNGWIYSDTTLQLKLMIDLKTEGISTLRKIVELFNSYPELTTAKGFEIFISGNVPSPNRWNEFPTFIHFDGRPGIQYTAEQRNRVTLISASFSVYSKWNGKDEMSCSDKNRIKELVQSVHAQQKKLRFWATPDFEKGWQALMDLGVDVIGSDNVGRLVQYLRNK